VPFSNEEVPQLTHEMLPPKEEHEALFKEYPRPDLDFCAPPKVDKYVSFLGGNACPVNMTLSRPRSNQQF